MYDRKRLVGGTGVSFLAVALVGAIVLSSGMAYAAPLGSTNGFTVEADEIRADEFLLYPSSGEDSAGSTPVVVVEQRDVVIEGLTLTRKQDVPMMDGTMEISFTAEEPVRADQQYIKMTGLHAKKSTFNGQVINAQPSQNPERQFRMTAGANAKPEDGYLTDINSGTPGMVQKDVTIEMAYLASNEISLPGLNVDVEYNPDPNSKG